MIKKLISSARSIAGPILRDCVGGVGAAMIAIGAGKIYPPAFWIVSGLLLVYGAIIHGRSV